MILAAAAWGPAHHGVGRMRMTGGAAIAAMMLAGTANAQCWDDAALKAAHVRDVQSMLMVATLRCQAAGIDVSAHYNAFVRAHRTALERHNLSLKAHFWTAGPIEGQRAYDRFTTQLANAYGAGDTGAESCAEAAAMAREAAADLAALEAVAQRVSILPALEAERCAPAGSVVMAAR